MIGSVCFGALNLYHDGAGALSDDQLADTLLMADVIANWVLDVQANTPPGTLAEELEHDADFHYIVHERGRRGVVQLGISVTEALIRLRGLRLQPRSPARRRGATAGVTGRSVRQRRAEGAALAVALVAVYVFMAPLAHDGAGDGIVYGVYVVTAPADRSRRVVGPARRCGMTGWASPCRSRSCSSPPGAPSQDPAGCG